MGGGGGERDEEEQRLTNFLNQSFQTFSKYLNFQKDNSELLFFILRQLTLDQLVYIRCKEGPNVTHVEVMERELMERAKQIEIFNLKPFYESDVFKNNGFSFDAKRKVIVQIVPEAAVF